MATNVYARERENKKKKREKLHQTGAMTKKKQTIDRLTCFFTCLHLYVAVGICISKYKEEKKEDKGLLTTGHQCFSVIHKPIGNISPFTEKSCTLVTFAPCI